MEDGHKYLVYTYKTFDIYYKNTQMCPKLMKYAYCSMDKQYIRKGFKND